MGSEKNPLEDYLIEKKAGFGGGLMHGLQSGFGGSAQGAGEMVGSSAARGALAAGGALAVAGGVSLAQKAYDVVTKARDFRTMLDHNQDLVAKQQENPRLFNQLFSTLRTFNPQFSQDPIVAGSYMRQMIESPDTAGGKVVDALNFRDKTKSSLGDTVTRAALGGKKK